MAETTFDLRAVAVRYHDIRALSDIDLRVGSGERVAIIGPSGAGKSSLIGLLNGTVIASSGSVRALGCDYLTASARAVRATQRRIGTIHQRFDLVDQLKTVHNVNAGRLGAWPFWKAAISLAFPQDVGDVRAALTRVGIGDKLYERTGDLSGGEQQRVAIARVLMQDPRAILADEPVASLDPARGREIISLLLDLSVESGVTLIASLHDVGMALNNFERVVGLRAGRIAFDKPRADLRPGEIDELYALERTAPPR